MTGSEKPTGQTIGAAAARRQLIRLLDEAGRGKRRVVVEKGGLPIAAIVSIADLELLQRLDEAAERQRTALSGILKAFADVPLDRLEAAVAEAISSVRAEKGEEQVPELRGLDEDEAPDERLDASYEAMLKRMHEFKLGIDEIATAKKRIEVQSSQLRADVARMEIQAERARRAGREDLARAVLIRRQAAEQQLQGLGTQIAQLEARQQKLSDVEARLSAKLGSFRAQKEVMRAQYAAAVAQVKIGQAAAEIKQELAEGALVMDVAEYRASQRQAPPAEKQR